ncbi:EAL domain-containing protein [Methylophilaceae bacterium 11]|uniref:EAL domain-containing protein n=1 Tax=Methylotenera sp. N17 TaxID=1502761 RepID=UPI00044A7103|nr:EAL domain-containing protein [Methylotenera sp. N17]EUJ10523.1 EAL domain-containing protein [Methylophilaceae bacterium 11]
MRLLDRLEDGEQTPYLRTLDIEYTAEHLAIKATQYQLEMHQLQGTYQADVDAIEALYLALDNEDKNDALEQLFVDIATWPSTMSWDAFCIRINTCIAHWVQAIQANTKLTSITSLLRCLALGHASGTGSTSTARLHLYLFEILSESLHTYEQHQIHFLLDHDAITNLPNTHLLIQAIAESAEPSSAPVELSLISIRFLIERGTNTISPTLPPALSIKIVELLTTCFPSAHSLFQSGALLFNVLLEKSIQPPQMNLLIAKIQRCFEQVIPFDHQAFIVTPVIGAAIQTQPNDYVHMVEHARIALNHALTSQLDAVIYTQAISDEADHQKKLELDITDAFNNEDLELYLQPIVGLPDGHCVGAEVLLRWPSAKSKGIYPNVMVEIINKVGLGKMFTRWLIHSVCRLAHQLINQNKLSVYLTLNLRAEDLYDKDLPLLILQSSQFWKIKPQDLILEITENGILEENETTLHTIQQMTDHGFRLALDDFGTGYSSMARLRNMPISLIKIDQSFVRDIHLSDKDFRMVQSMASLAESLDKEVLVEGVENEAALQLINQIGITKAQGYYFSKPMPFDEFVQWAKINSAS